MYWRLWFNIYTARWIVMNGRQRNATNTHKYGKTETTRIMMSNVRHESSSSGLTKFQAG